MILIKRLGYLVILLYLFVACGGDEDEPVSFLISKMEYIDIAAKDTTNMYFTYKEGELSMASVVSNSEKSYTAIFDDNGKVYDVGDKRFEWDGDQLVKIIFDNGTWIDLEYSGEKVNKGFYRYFQPGGQVASSGHIDVSYDGNNLAILDNYDNLENLTSKYSYSAFDNMVNTFGSIWWFLYVDNTLSLFTTQVIPSAMYMINNPASFKFEAPMVQFERTASLAYEYDSNGRVSEVNISSQGKEFKLIIIY